MCTILILEERSYGLLVGFAYYVENCSTFMKSSNIPNIFTHTLYPFLATIIGDSFNLNGHTTSTSPTTVISDVLNDGREKLRCIQEARFNRDIIGLLALLNISAAKDVDRSN